MSESIYMVNYEGYLYKWNGVDAWALQASQVVAGDVNCMTKYNDELYIGCDRYKMYKWDGASGFTDLTSFYSGYYSIDIRALTNYNSKIYAAAGDGFSDGKLLEWDGVDRWTLKGSVPAEALTSIKVFNGKLYVGTSGADLFEWNDVDTLTEVGSQTFGNLSNLVEYNSKLYASSTNGELFVWNDVDILTEVAPYLVGIAVYDLLNFNSKIYGGTGGGTVAGKLLEWNGLNAWSEVVDGLNDYEINSDCMVEYNSKLYAVDGWSSLLEWNGVNVWVEKAPQPIEWYTVGVRVCLDPTDVDKYKAWIM